LGSFRNAHPHNIFYDGEYAYLADQDRALVILEYGPGEADAPGGLGDYGLLLIAV
jgi:hypothetical protein